VLRAANYICYSPSYGQADEDAKVEHNITSIYLNSSQVKLGVKFGCAHCSELSGIGYSQLKHLTGCPFTSDLIDCHEEASMGDSDAEGNSLICVLKAILSMNKVITPPGHDEDEDDNSNLVALYDKDQVDDSNSVAVYDERPLVLNLNESDSSFSAAVDLYQQHQMDPLQLYVDESLIHFLHFMDS
jgi:hypothetical protein